ncbi:MAG TPA: hypothetical protein VGP83_17210 [Pyrinomonadaceae bacterium]|jgi:hypothetical protein|nr:hypothetical protein [Pyrinomonadaceae bacterium]
MVGIEESDPNEIGRALSANELIERTIVCVSLDETHTQFASFWVEHVAEDYVAFLANAAQPAMHFMVMRFADDTLVDADGKRVAVREYLGEE